MTARWVAYRDGRFFVRSPGRVRELTFTERVAWYLFKRVPR